MFERYTEKARRVIFFARYEASQFGSPYIETEHLLLGILREDKGLTSRFILKSSSPEAIRLKIEAASPKREKVATSVDLPLSNEGKRALAYAAEEAERLSHRHIGTEHLFLGLMREEKSFAGQLLQECGLKLTNVREDLANAPATAPQGTEETSLLSPVRNQLTDLARKNLLNAFVGREKEMERLIQVLGRSTKNSVVLIGARGAGKRALVEGLARKIVEGDAPSHLGEKAILDFDVARMSGPGRSQAIENLTNGKSNLFFMEDLISVLASISPMVLPTAAEILKGLLLDGKVQCICSATSDDYRDAAAVHPWIKRCFSSIEIKPMTEEETLAVLRGAQSHLESFHGVMLSQDVLRDAVRYASAFVHDEVQPDKALDLLDEACAHVKARRQLPEEIREVQKRIRFIVDRMENAVVNHEFEKARFYSEEERKETEQLRELQEKHKIGVALEVTRRDIEEILSQWTGIPLDQIQKGSPG